MPASSRSPFLPLAAVVLVLDGLVAFLLGGVALLMSTAVAAIQGQTGDPNGHLAWWALGLFLVGAVAFVAAWRTARGGGARMVGALITGMGALIAAYAAWSSAASGPFDSRAIAVSAAIFLAQVAATLVLGTHRSATARPATATHE